MEAEQPQQKQPEDQAGPVPPGGDAGDLARSAQPSRGLPPLPSISTVRVPSDPAVLARRLPALEAGMAPQRSQARSSAFSTVLTLSCIIQRAWMFAFQCKTWPQAACRYFPYCMLTACHFVNLSQAQQHAVAALMSLLGVVMAQPETVGVTEPLPFSNDSRPILPNQGTADAEDAARTADSAAAGRTGSASSPGKAVAPAQSASGA